MDNQSTARHSRLLFRTLGANGAFSLTSGLLGIFASRPIATFLSVPDSRWILALGIGLVAFGAVLLVRARSQSMSRFEVLIISAMDLGWVLASIAAVIVFRELLTSNAIISIIAIAVVILTFFDLQVFALWREAARLRTPLVENPE